MKLFQLYITRTILQTTGLVLFALIGVEILFLFLNEVRKIGTGNYGVTQAFLYVLLNVPNGIYQLFPIIGLIGILLGLGILATHSELIAMQAAGFSMRDITVAVLKTASVMIIAITLLGETAAPYAKRIADINKTVAMSAGQALGTGQGAWIREGQSFIHIQDIVSQDHLRGISRYLFDEQHRLILANYADHAYYKDKHWTFYQVIESRIQVNKVTSREIPEASLSLSIKPDLLKTIAAEPRSMAIQQLYKAIVHYRNNDLNADHYLLAFWQRIWQPFASLVMMYLAIPFLLGPLRNSTLGLQLILGLTVGFGFYILNEFLGAATLAFQIPSAITTALPTLLFGLVGWLLTRTR